MSTTGPGLETGRALLDEARRGNSSLSRTIVASLLASALEPERGVPDRSARRDAALLVAEQFGDAADAFRSALATGVGADPINRAAYEGIAEALLGQGRVYASLQPGLEREAVSSFTQAGAALDAALALKDGADLLKAKATVLRASGNVYNRLHEWDEAGACYGKAAAALDAALRLAPDDTDARLGRAVTLAAWATLGARGGSPAWSPRLPEDPQGALARHAAALVAYEEALQSGAAPRVALALKASELRDLGDLQRTLSRRRASLASYRQAVRLLDEVVTERPSQRWDRGMALERAGDVARELGRVTEAVRSYERGIADLESVAGRPGYGDFARGSMLVRLGELHLGAGRLQEARTSLQQGLEVLVGTSGITDDDRLSRDRLINRGRALLTG